MSGNFVKMFWNFSFDFSFNLEFAIFLKEKYSNTGRQAIFC